MVSSTPRPHFTPGKDPVPILQEAGWAPGPVWTGGKYRPHQDSIPDRPARSQSLYRLSYPAHLTEMSTRSISWGKGGRCVKLTTLPPSCGAVTKSGTLNFLEHSAPVQACNGTDLPVPLQSAQIVLGPTRCLCWR